MKKIIKLFICSIFILSSCQKIEKPFYLDDEYYSEEGKIEIIESYDTILENENQKKNFLVYVYTPGCMSCASFKPILNEYVKNNNLIVYGIAYSIVSEHKTKISKKVKYSPSVVIYYQGKIIDYLDATNNDYNKYYETYAGFSSWIESYIKIKEPN